MKAYLDSNVILDVLDENRKCHEDSGKIIEFAKDFGKQLELVVSVQSMIDAY
jgi:predicted nucleic acid-binding protein